MSLAITCVAASAAGSDENRTKARLRCENVIIEGNITA
jgi:hypothetical protein